MHLTVERNVEKQKRKKSKQVGRQDPITLSKAMIAVVVAAMTGQLEESDEEGDSEQEEEIPMKPPAKKQKIVNNWTNPALQRNKKNGG